MYFLLFFFSFFKLLDKYSERFGIDIVLIFSARKINSRFNKNGLYTVPCSACLNIRELWILWERGFFPPPPPLFKAKRKMEFSMNFKELNLHSFFFFIISWNVFRIKLKRLKKIRTEKGLGSWKSTGLKSNYKVKYKYDLEKESAFTASHSRIYNKRLFIFLIPSRKWALR